MGETSMSKRNLPQRAIETPNSGISLRRKSGAVTKMALQRARNHTDGSGQQPDRGPGCGASH